MCMRRASVYLHMILTLKRYQGAEVVVKGLTRTAHSYRLRSNCFLLLFVWRRECMKDRPSN